LFIEVFGSLNPGFPLRRESGILGVNAGAQDSRLQTFPRGMFDAGILATSFMHTHKSVPIADLPHRVPHLRNCRPSALEVILQIPVRRRPNVCASSHLLHDPPWTSLSFFTQSTPMVVGVLHLHQRHALAQWSV